MTPGGVDGGPLMMLVYLSNDPSRIIYFALAAMLRGWTHDGRMAKEADDMDDRGATSSQCV